MIIKFYVPYLVTDSNELTQLNLSELIQEWNLSSVSEKDKKQFILDGFNTILEIEASFPDNTIKSIVRSYICGDLFDIDMENVTTTLINSEKLM